MSGDLEAAGAMASAGLIAGAMEGREPSHAGEGACLNCGAQLGGRFCGSCGQASHVHRSLVHMGEEFLHGLLHVDTKAWRTLPMLVFRPGTLTRAYVFGKRVRYISPLALFLFSIFAMFFVFAFAPMPIRVNSNAVERGVAAARAEAGLERAQAELAQTPGGSAAAEALRAREDALREEIARLEAGAQDAPRWQDAVRTANAEGRLRFSTGVPAIDARIRHSLENPDLALYKTQQAAYKFSFLLAPLSLPFIWLIFAWRRGVTLYDHMIFALYALSFVSLLFIVIALLSQTRWGEALVGPLFLTAMPVHTFFHLRGAYALGWFSAAWRTILMLIMACVVLALFLGVIVMLGLAG